MNYNRIFIVVCVAVALNFSAKISSNDSLAQLPSFDAEFEAIKNSESFKQMTQMLGQLSELHQKERKKLYEKYRKEIAWIIDNYATNKRRCENLLIAISKEFESIVQNGLNDEVYAELSKLDPESTEEQKTAIVNLVGSLSELALTYELSQMCGIENS